jgi:thiol:disulfide interchange protein
MFRRRLLIPTCFAILTLTVLGCSLFSTGPGESRITTGFAQQLNPVTFSGKLEPDEVKPGQSAKVLITARIEPRWHLYSLTQGPGGPKPTRITIEESSIVKPNGNPQQPKPKAAPDPNFSLPGQPPFMSETFDKEVTFTVPVKFAADVPKGSQKFRVKVNFMACDDHQCLPPRNTFVEVASMVIASNAKPSPGISAVIPSPNPTVSSNPKVSPEASSPTPVPAAGSGVGAPSPPAAADPTDDEIANRLKRQGLINYILFAMGVGLLSLLTPCVFPMIPITVSFFTKREHRTTGEAIKQALIYCFGIIFTFTGLGLALTLLAGPAGINRVAANPWMNLFLTTLFVVFALNLFGLFEIRLPTGLISKLDTKSQSGTTAATLLMGLTFTLTSFTCTAAFVGTVLVAVTQGEWFWPAVGMIAFSSAFALPFFLLAIFPKWIQTLPKSGGWLNSVKVVMGFLELGAAFKFLSNVDLVWGWNTVSRNVVLGGWILITVLTAIYLLGKLRFPLDTPLQKLGVARILSATFFLALTIYFGTGLFGGKLGEWEALLPPGHVETKWVHSYEEALAIGRAENKPVFLNFTGVTCTNCRWMESNMFPEPQVKKELEGFVLAELFTDRETPEDEKNGELQAQKFETVALPLYAVVDPSGNILAKFPGLTRDKQEFVGFLQRGAGKMIAPKMTVTSVKK